MLTPRPPRVCRLQSRDWNVLRRGGCRPALCSSAEHPNPARLWTVISNEVIKCRRGGERTAATFSIKLRYFGTSLIKIGRLEFQLTKHSIPLTHSQSAGGQS